MKSDTQMEAKPVVFVSFAKALLVWIPSGKGLDGDRDKQVQFQSNGRVGVYTASTATEIRHLRSHPAYGKQDKSGFWELAENEKIPKGMSIPVRIGPRNSLTQGIQEPETLDPRVAKTIEESNLAAARPANMVVE